jgi:phosphatidylinositol alpha 1,6-mannosyltransferase
MRAPAYKLVDKDTPTTSCKVKHWGVSGRLIVSVQAHIELRHGAEQSGRTPASERAASLRIALVASSYNYIRDGVALTLNRLVSYLERHGAEVLVFAPVGSAPAFDHAGTLVPVPSFALPPRPEYRFALGMPRLIVDRLRRFRPDVIHIALAPDLLGYSALRAARRLAVPVVASCHTRFETYLKHYWYTAPFEGLLKAYLRHAYGQCREVYVPSQSMIDALKADGMRDNFKLWPRGVDTEQFHPDRRSGEWRAKHGFGAGEFVIAFVSRLVREKQLDTLVATLQRMKALGIAHRALIVGDGPERAAIEGQMPDAVFTGFLTGDELAQAYASADAFVFPSETETFGNVTLEAMASGLPCVCADATGSRCLVEHERTGYLVEPRRADLFADRLAVLAQDTGLRRQLGDAARQRALGFSWDEAMACILRYYRSQLGNGAS